MLYGAAYYPEHRDPNRWADDLDAMAAACVNAVRVGEFAWKRFEPARGTYDFAWMDRFSELAQARGIGLLMCPPLRTVPAWLVEADPTLQIVDERGIRLSYGSRYTFCINHPWLLERGMELARRMARHWAGCDTIVGWHLDNEYGDEPDCHCPRCRQKFQQWLTERYESIDRLKTCPLSRKAPKRRASSPMRGSPEPPRPRRVRWDRDGPSTSPVSRARRS